MIQPLGGARWKLRRANDHIRQLEVLVKEFTEAKPYEVFADSDPDAGQSIFRMRVLRTMPTREWGLLVGDAIHNLRSALDHAVWDASVLKSGNPSDPLPSPWRRVGFPVFVDKAKFHKRKRNGDPAPDSGLAPLWAVSKRVRTFVEGTQPYHRGKDSPRDPLAVLNELWNTDKHRFIPIIGHSTTTRLGGLPDPFVSSVRRRITRGPFETGVELLRTQFSAVTLASEPPMFEVGDKVEMSMYLDVAVHVAFEDGPPAYGGRVVPTLKTLSKVVNHTLVGLQIAMGAPVP